MTHLSINNNNNDNNNENNSSSSSSQQSSFATPILLNLTTLQEQTVIQQVRDLGYKMNDIMKVIERYSFILFFNFQLVKKNSSFVFDFFSVFLFYFLFTQVEQEKRRGDT